MHYYVHSTPVSCTGCLPTVCTGAMHCLMSTVRVEVAWLQANDVMLCIAKSIYLIGVIAVVAYYFLAF